MGSRMRAFRAWAGALAAVAVVATTWASAVGDVILQDPNDGLPTGPFPRPVFMIETDKAVYSLGDTVHVLHRVTNGGDADYRMDLTQTPAFDLHVLNDSRRLIWSAHWGEAFYAFHPGIVLTAGESIQHQYSWEMVSNDELRVAPGEYHIIGVVHGDTDVSTSILVIPEPMTIALLGMSCWWLVVRRRHCTVASPLHLMRQ